MINDYSCEKKVLWNDRSVLESRLVNELYMPIRRWRWCMVYNRVSIEQGTQHTSLKSKSTWDVFFFCRPCALLPMSLYVLESAYFFFSLPPTILCILSVLLVRHHLFSIPISLFRFSSLHMQRQKRPYNLPCAHFPGSQISSGPVFLVRRDDWRWVMSEAQPGCYE